MANRRAAGRGGYAASGRVARRGAQAETTGSRRAMRGELGNGEQYGSADRGGSAGGRRSRPTDRGARVDAASGGPGERGERSEATVSRPEGRRGYGASGQSSRRGARVEAASGGPGEHGEPDGRRSRPGGRRGDDGAGRKSFDRPHPDRTPELEREFVAGRRAVIEGLKGERSLNRILVQEEATGGSLTEILALARGRGVVVQRVPRGKLDDIARETRHQGVLAYVSAKHYAELDDLIELARRRKPGLLVILDGLEDPHNLGSVIRTAEGSGAAGVVIAKRRAVPLTGTVAKASAGALEHVEVARVPNLNQAIDRLKAAGFWVVGAAPDADQNYYEADFTAPTAVVIGGEAEGLSRLTAERCDILVKIPMQGRVGSLNAGVAAGVLLYEAVRQRALL